MKKPVRLDGEHVFGEKGFQLDVSTWEQHGNYPLHTHSFSEIAIIIEGSGTTNVDGQLFHFHAGDVFVLHGDRPHAYLNTHNVTLINITPERFPAIRLCLSSIPYCAAKNPIKDT